MCGREVWQVHALPDWFDPRRRDDRPDHRGRQGDGEHGNPARSLRHDEIWIIVRAWRLHARSEEHTSELQSLMRISYAVFCLKKKKKKTIITPQEHTPTPIYSVNQ